MTSANDAIVAMLENRVRSKLTQKADQASTRRGSVTMLEHLE